MRTSQCSELKRFLAYLTFIHSKFIGSTCLLCRNQSFIFANSYFIKNKSINSQLYFKWRSINSFLVFFRNCVWSNETNKYLDESAGWVTFLSVVLFRNLSSFTRTFALSPTITSTLNRISSSFFMTWIQRQILIIFYAVSLTNGKQPASAGYIFINPVSIKLRRLFASTGGSLCSNGLSSWFAVI